MDFPSIKPTFFIKDRKKELPPPGHRPLTYPTSDEASDPNLRLVGPYGQAMNESVDTEVVDGGKVTSVARPADCLQREQAGEKNSLISC